MKEEAHPLIPFDGSDVTIAKWIATTIKPASVLDWGCHDGRLLTVLNEVHDIPWKEMAGIDVPGQAHRFLGPKKAFWVPGVHPFTAGAFELVVCMEVAEHLSPESADGLVQEVATLAEKWILWSAATPGQGGWGHVNEQPHEFWLEKFRAHGFRAKFVGMEVANMGPLAWWYAKNAYLLSREGYELGGPATSPHGEEPQGVSPQQG